MYKIPKYQKTQIHINESVEGETIEQKVERLIANKEPITDSTVELLFTERKDGVMAGYNIRTDRFEVAIEAMDKAHKSSLARREAKMEIVKNDKKNDGKPEPTQGKTSTDNMAENQ